MGLRDSLVTLYKGLGCSTGTIEALLPEAESSDEAEQVHHWSYKVNHADSLYLHCFTFQRRAPTRTDVKNIATSQAAPDIINEISQAFSSTMAMKL